MPRRLSQRRSCRQDIVSDALTEARVGDDIDVASERIAEIHEQPAQVEQAAPLVEADDEVDVARGRGVAAHHRSEDPHVRSAVTLRNAKELLTAIPQIGECDGDGVADRLHIRIVACTPHFRKVDLRSGCIAATGGCRAHPVADYTEMESMELHAAIHEDDDGSLWAEVRELPGCFASGATIAELTEALIEAVGLCLDDGSSGVRVGGGSAPPVRARVGEMTLVTV